MAQGQVGCVIRELKALEFGWEMSAIGPQYFHLYMTYDIIVLDQARIHVQFFYRVVEVMLKDSLL